MKDCQNRSRKGNLEQTSGFSNPRIPPWLQPGTHLLLRAWSTRLGTLKEKQENWGAAAEQRGRWGCKGAQEVT